MAINKKLIHFNTFKNFNLKKLSANVENTQYTLGVDGEVQTGSPDILYQSICYIKDTKQQWTHGQLYDCNSVDLSEYLTADEIAEIYATIESLDEKQDALVSGQNIKTINGESILGEGNLIIEGSGRFILPLSLFEETPTISQEDYDNLVNAVNNGVVISVPVEMGLSSVISAYQQGVVGLVVSLETLSSVNEVSIIISPELNVIMGGENIYPKTSKLSEFENDSNFISSDNLKTINGESIVGSGNIEIEDSTYIFEWDGSESGTITQDQWDALQRADNVLIKGSANNIYPTHIFQKTTDTINIQLITSTALEYWNLINITVNSDLSYQIHSRNATYIKSGGLKTINGESLEGSGDIVISVESSSGNSAYPETSHGTTDTTFTLTPNTFHIWDEVSALTLTLGAETSGVANEYLFQFTSGSTPTTLSLPDDIKWTDGETPTIEANKIYQVSILKGLGSILNWENS